MKDNLFDLERSPVLARLLFWFEPGSQQSIIDEGLNQTIAAFRGIGFSVMQPTVADGGNCRIYLEVSAPPRVYEDALDVHMYFHETADGKRQLLVDGTAVVPLSVRHLVQEIQVPSPLQEAILADDADEAA